MQNKSKKLEELLRLGLDKTEKGTIEWYERAYEVCKIDSDKVSMVSLVCFKLLKSKSRYEEVAERVWNRSEAWWIVAGIHFKEASGNFKSVLHNGEKIIGTGKKTSLVPVGRGPFKTWEDAAIDALTRHSIGKLSDYSMGVILQAVESYNGRGYLTGAGKGENSPYLWACTNVNDGFGKYVADGKFNPDAPTESSPGFCALVKCFENYNYLEILK